MNMSLPGMPETRIVGAEHHTSIDLHEFSSFVV